jgi:hypothetical protein
MNAEDFKTFVFLLSFKNRLLSIKLLKDVFINLSNCERFLINCLNNNNIIIESRQCLHSATDLQTEMSDTLDLPLIADYYGYL